MRIHVILLLIISFILSCNRASLVNGNNNNGNGSNNGGNGTTARILVAGEDDLGYPVLYDGNTKIILDTVGKRGSVSKNQLGDIYLNGNDVYLSTSCKTVGSYFSGYWKNGTWYSMLGYCTNANNNTEFSTPFIKGNDIYVTGVNSDTIRVWKNGTIFFQKLFTYGIMQGAHKILNVDDQGNIYFCVESVSSQDGSWFYPCSQARVFTEYRNSIYKNDNEIWYWTSTFSRNTSCYYSWTQRYDIIGLYYGSGFDIYTLFNKVDYSGMVLRSLTWDFRKNLGSNLFTVTATNSAYLNSLSYGGACFKNGNCYISGSDSNYSYKYGKYWINGYEHILFEVPVSAVAGHLGSIDVKDSAIYVAGRAEKNSNDIYWKNGVPVAGRERFACYRIKVY